MSQTPNPVAVTASLLVSRWFMLHPKASGGYCLALSREASDLHRLAPAVQRVAEAICSDEDAYDGHSAYVQDMPRPEDNSAAYWYRLEERLDKRITRLNESLAPLALEAFRTGDPRGYTLRLRSTDPARPLPANELGGDYGIAARKGG